MTVLVVICKTVDMQNNSQWPCSMCPIPQFRLVGVSVTEHAEGWLTINYYRKDSPFLSLEVPPHTHLLGLQCPLPEERRLSMPESGEKERNYLFKSYTDL